MSNFDRFLRHSLTVVRLDPDESQLDDYGQPSTTSIDLVTVPCRIDPRLSPLGRAGAGEEINSQSVGAELNDFIVFMRPTDVTASDYLRAADGTQYRILQVRDGGGAGHHLEIDVRRITPDIPIPATV